ERFALILTQPFKTARRRIDAWIFTRLKRVPGPVLVSRRRVYILPTRYGYVFGLGLVAMNHTHANLVDVQVRTGRVQPVFAGDTARFTLELDNPAPVARYALAGGWTDHTPQHATGLAPQRSGSLV